VAVVVRGVDYLLLKVQGEGDEQIRENGFVYLADYL